MNCLFLDFDGVLNSSNWFHKREKIIFKELSPDYYKHQLDPYNIKNLNSILSQTDCKIVISSTWRRGNLIGFLVRLLIDLGVDIDKYRRFIGTTPVLGTPRGLEIQSWITDYDQHHPTEKVNKICILDDDGDMEHLMDKLVLCHGIEGLTEEKALEAIKMLS